MDGRANTLIFFVTRKWPPAIGGMETYAARLVERLRSLAKVEVIALPGQKDGSPPPPAALLYFGMATTIRLLSAKPADVVHIGDMASWPFGLIARLRSRRTRIVLSAHGTDVSFPFRGGFIARLYGLYLRLGALFLRSSAVIANSSATADAVKRHGFTHVAIIPLATDIDRRFEVAAHGSDLLFVGRLTPRKGCAWFIRNVLPLLPREISLKVAGTVWSEDEQAALSDPRVTFLGPCHGDGLFREYASALCVVIPNIDVPTREFEGFGLIAVEAAASGGLVLASRHSGLKESVIDGVTGFHLPPGDAEAWAQKVRDIHSWRPDLRRAFIANAIAKTQQYYSWDRVARETLQAYRQLPLAVPDTHSDGANRDLMVQ